MSRKTPLISTVGLLSKAVSISWIIDSNWEGAAVELKKSVGCKIDTFGSNKKFHTVTKVLNYRFIKWTYLVKLLTHWMSAEKFYT